MIDRPIIIAPSILAADFGHLQDEVDSVADSADWLQADVMDGHFVPNLSFGAPVVKCIKTDLPVDVHLMVSNPSQRIEEFLQAGAGNITFHAETIKNTEERKRIIEAIRAGGATAGIALSPETPLEDIKDVLGDIDLLLIMSVHPGFSGQSFIEDVLDKVKSARETYPDLMIQMDGGISAKTAGRCIEAGANNLVSGSFIFDAEDRTMAIKSLRES